VNVKVLVPTTSDPISELQTQPESAFTVPLSINIKLPATEAPDWKSVALVGTPETFTV
jgi:hypothetical protein